jgi:hypothetical protein
MIEELELVALARAVPEHKLAAGDVGTVVLIHGGGKGYTVEFATIRGTTIGVATLNAADIRPITEHEIAHARQVA